MMGKTSFASSMSSDLLTVHHIRPETTKGMQAFFQALDYEWTTLEKGVPPIILEQIPQDIDKTRSINTKKRSFFMALLPMILLANQEIKNERKEVLDIFARHRNGQMAPEDSLRIQEILKRYGLRGHPLTDHRARTRLLKRVDTIPPALVLAQAANESAWGTSRFARLGNNIFGQWTFKPGSGIVPSDRPPGAIYEIRKFSSIFESIRSYMNNLNRHAAYFEFRKIREDLRLKGKPLSGLALAQGLIRYSQRGEEYIREIQTMIRQNKLARTNSLTLRPIDTNQIISLNMEGAGLVSSRNKMIGHLSPGR